MDDGRAQDASNSALDAETAALRELARRISDLEQQVAELRRGKGRPVVSDVPVRPPADAPLPPSVVQVSTPRLQQRSLEDRLGSQFFNFIGILAILFGSSWALKLAIDHGLLGPSARIAIGLIAGAAVVVWSEHLRRRGVPAFSYTLKAVGSSLLYLSLWAGFQLFHLFPAGVAVFAMLLVTAWNGYMAWSQEAELLALYALLGGLLTPVLLTTGTDSEGFLFTYLALIDLGTVLLLKIRPWPRLLVPAFLGTVAYFAAYFISFFHSQAAGNAWDGQSAETTAFALVFAGIFSFVTMKPRRSEAAMIQERLSQVLLPLANAAFVGSALAAILEASGLHAALPWVMVVLAAVFLALVRLQQTSASAASHLAAAIVYLTVAIPLKTSGQSLTVAWLVEGLALYWVSCTMRSETAYKCRALTLLSGVSYGLGLGSLGIHWASSWDWTAQAIQPASTADLFRVDFFTANLASAVVAVATLGGATWLALPRISLPGLTRTTRPANLRVLLASLLALDAVALLLALGELFSVQGHRGAAFANADFARTLISLALLAGTAWTARRIAYPNQGPIPHPRQTELFRHVAQIEIVLFNLLALFSLVQETSALWTEAAESLQRSLAVSAVLMVYAAMLLALGFWRQQAFIRWQALVLILLTIAKVFLSDISGLSAGYRVASFLALGALLLTVSFAYQKDWLSLRAHAKVPAGGELG